MGSSPDAIRGRILAHAADRFMASGFRRVTMEQLARELGVSKKTLYSHFPGKQDLLSAAIAGQLDGLKARLDAAFGAHDLPFSVRFERLLQAVGAQLAAVHYPLIDDLYRHAPRVWQEIDEFRRTCVFSRLERLLRQGVREGYVRSDIEPRLIMFIITEIAQSALSPAQLLELGASPAQVFAAVMSLLYRGVFTDRGRRGVGAPPAARGSKRGRKTDE